MLTSLMLVLILVSSKVVDPVGGCHYFGQDPRLPARLYTAWWCRDICCESCGSL